MDNSNMILTGSVSPPTPLEVLKKPDSVSEQRKKEFAKNFESIFIHKLLDEMKNTIGEWGLEKDGTSKQVDGIFWTYLARDIGDNGGFGLWKDIYASLSNQEGAGSATESGGDGL